MIESHQGRNQVRCDSCPASYPNTYANEDFAVMIADAKTAGWIIRKAKPPKDDGDTAELFGDPEPVEGARIARKDGEKDQPFTHTCPDCAARNRIEGRLF